MKNPLSRRLPRELLGDFGKYLVIFLFLTVTIGFISGFMVASNSMAKAYDDSFDKYNIEDGHFILDGEIPDGLTSELKDEGAEVYELFYKELLEDGQTYRIYKNRTQVNKVCLMAGQMPSASGEIVIDRLYAENRDIAIGDSLTIGGDSYTVCGTVALSDYSALFRNSSDTMFDAQNFTVAIVTDGDFDSLPESALEYDYAWLYTDDDLSESEKYDKNQDLMYLIAASAPLNYFVPELGNQAIHFTGNDIGNDSNMMMVLLYIVIVILAFVFAVTTANTIEKESTVIGTLRASGYTRRELLNHYMSMPVIVSLISAVLGNVLGYTLLKQVIVAMYYGSYSLPTYTTVWSGYAFVITTVVPIIIMLVINFLILRKKLSLSPLKFLRRDLKKHGNRRAARLPEFKFFTRFRLRVILQNRSSYLILFIGIFFSSVLLMFGLMLTPLLHHYEDEALSSMISQYQYILKAPVETQGDGAEKFAVTTLLTDYEDKGMEDEISVYGISGSSRYALPKVSGGSVIISDGFAEKYALKAGDELRLKQRYEDESYTFTVTGIYDYPSSLSVFMDIGAFRNSFDKDDGFFNGYFSDSELTDIDDRYIASTITVSDLT
ncbi:MAG: ABC transporter permease, partial [Oscillospiraceae bacterium]|nr:ABC transporter permease [Oscillospiraceae bacterium]